MEKTKNPKNSSSKSSNQNDSKNSNINQIQNKEIDLLKKEISELKTQREQDKKNIDELKSLFQTEIKKLQNQLKSLSEEIVILKIKKKKKEDDNINNDNIINEDNIDNDMEIEDNKYSLECLSRKLSIDIAQGTDRVSLDIAIKNNSKEKYPENSCLICDSKNSHLLCDDVELGELEPNQQKIITIWFKNLKCISKGIYKCYIILKIGNKVYNSSKIELTLNVVLSQNIQNNNIFHAQNNPMIQNNFNNFNNINISNPLISNNNLNQDELNNKISIFRAMFDLFDDEICTDERIKNALINNGYDYGKAFASLYN